MKFETGKETRKEKGILLALAGSLALLGGCLEKGASDPELEKVVAPPATATNNPPTISGTPTNSVRMGNSYAFVPTASDPDGDTLTFSIRNKPVWAAFNTANGSMSGEVQLGDIGMYQNIAITVSDGDRSAQLPPFSVQVVQQGDGTVTLSWTPPTENTDGSPLVDLASYRIYYGLAVGDYPNQVVIDNPGIATFVVEGLTPNTYFFVATAVNTQGVESDFSNVTSKVVL